MGHAGSRKSVCSWKTVTPRCGLPHEALQCLVESPTIGQPDLGQMLCLGLRVSPAQGIIGAGSDVFLIGVPRMTAAKPGEEFAEIVPQFLDDVYRYAYHLTGDRFQAEDLTQEVFLRAQRKWHQLRSRDHLWPWLTAICRRIFLNRMRKHRRECPVSPDSLDHRPAQEMEQTGLDAEHLARALATLSPRSRVLLMMFYFEGLSYRQIASRLGLPIGTVMSGLSRAKMQLRAKLVAGMAPPQPATSSITWGKSP